MPEGASQGEGLAVWALLLADALAVFAVYSILDPAELYAVSEAGVDGGLSRALVHLNFPIALVAIPLALLALAVLPRPAWILGAPAVALCAVVAVPGVVDPRDLDARPVNVLPALGAGIALALTGWAVRRAGVRFVPRSRGDSVRLVVAGLALLASLPWITAELGAHLPGPVFLTSELYAEPGQPTAAAVHLGHHHGLAGTIFVLSALVLSRPVLPRGRLAVAYAALVSLMLVYGAANLVEDLWHEQVVKRGWTAWDVPSALEPAPTPAWGLVLAGAALAYALGFARHAGGGPEQR